MGSWRPSGILKQIESIFNNYGFVVNESMMKDQKKEKLWSHNLFTEQVIFSFEDSPIIWGNIIIKLYIHVKPKIKLTFDLDFDLGGYWYFLEDDGYLYDLKLFPKWRGQRTVDEFITEEILKVASNYRHNVRLQRCIKLNNLI